MSCIKQNVAAPSEFLPPAMLQVTYDIVGHDLQYSTTHLRRRTVVSHILYMIS